MAPVFQLYRFWGEDGVWWRLLSANRRGLARSAESYPTAQSARAGLARVLADADSLELGVRLTAEHRWHWSLRLAGTVLVEGVGTQDRRARCVGTGRAFQVVAAGAPVEADVAVFRRPGRRPVELGPAR